MSNNRAQTWPRECPYCGQTYRLTNFMIRRFDHEGRPLPSGMPGRRTDTHLIGCEKRQQASASDEPS